MFATAVEDDDLRSDQSVNRRRDSDEEEPVAKSMTTAELARLLEAIPEHRLLLFELLAHTGLRISEALGLDWSDIEFGEKPRLHVRRQHYRGKTKRLKTSNGRRTLPLNADLAKRLWLSQPVEDDGPVFATQTGERHHSERNLRRVLDKAACIAGVPWVGYHTFRHTCASALLADGKNIRQVADWLGHADPAFTLRTYAHLMDGDLGEPLSRGALLGATSGATEHPDTAANDARVRTPYAPV